MTVSNKSMTYMEYISRINRVQDYIEANLRGDISLDTLAEISGFSKFHFHRIFRGIVKETLLSYINRIRMERAIFLLLHNPYMSITEVAMTLGFSESPAFSRLFKKHYGISASEVRRCYSKNCQVDSKNGKANSLLPAYNEDITNISREDDVMLVKGNVEVRVIEEIKAVYLRHSGSYEELAVKFHEMISKLMNWANARNLLNNEDIKLFSIYHDNPEFTAQESLKTSICLAVSQDVEVNGEVGKMMIPSGKYAIGHFEIDDPSDHTNAWNYIYGQWLPNSGFQPEEGYVFEMYVNDPNTHPEKKHFIDIYIPIKPL